MSKKKQDCKDAAKPLCRAKDAKAAKLPPSNRAILRTVVRGLLLLAIAHCLTPRAFGAYTVTGLVNQVTSQALNTALSFFPGEDIYSLTNGLSGGPAKSIYSTNGAFTVTLDPGNYLVRLPLVPTRNPFTIRVPIGTGTNNIASLISEPWTQEDFENTIGVEGALTNADTRAIRFNGNSMTLRSGAGPALLTGERHNHNTNSINFSDGIELDINADLGPIEFQIYQDGNVTALTNISSSTGVFHGNGGGLSNIVTDFANLSHVATNHAYFQPSQDGDVLYDFTPQPNQYPWYHTNLGLSIGTPALNQAWTNQFQVTNTLEGYGGELHYNRQNSNAIVNFYLTHTNPPNRPISKVEATVRTIHLTGTPNAPFLFLIGTNAVGGNQHPGPALAGYVTHIAFGVDAFAATLWTNGATPSEWIHSSGGNEYVPMGFSYWTNGVSTCGVEILAPNRWRLYRDGFHWDWVCDGLTNVSGQANTATFQRWNGAVVDGVLPTEVVIQKLRISSKWNNYSNYLAGALSGKANLAGGNTFTGNQIISAAGGVGVLTISNAVNIRGGSAQLQLFDRSDPAGEYIGFFSSGSTRLRIFSQVDGAAGLLSFTNNGTRLHIVTTAGYGGNGINPILGHDNNPYNLVGDRVSAKGYQATTNAFASGYPLDFSVSFIGLQTNNVVPIGVAANWNNTNFNRVLVYITNSTPASPFQVSVPAWGQYLPGGGTPPYVTNLWVGLFFAAHGIGTNYSAYSR